MPTSAPPRIRWPYGPGSHLAARDPVLKKRGIKGLSKASNLDWQMRDELHQKMAAFVPAQPTETRCLVHRDRGRNHRSLHAIPPDADFRAHHRGKLHSDEERNQIETLEDGAFIWLLDP